MKNKIQFSFIIAILIVLPLAFFGCFRQSEIKVKIKDFKYLKTTSTKEIMKDNNLKILFDDCLDKSINVDFDLYSFCLVVRNNMSDSIHALYKTEVIESNNKMQLVTNGRDLKGANIFFSPEISRLGLNSRYSIAPHEYEQLVFYMLVKSGEKPPYDVSFCCLVGENNEYKEIPFVVE